MTPKGAKDNPRKFGPGLAAFQPLHITEVVTSESTYSSLLFCSFYKTF